MKKLLFSLIGISLLLGSCVNETLVPGRGKQEPVPANTLRLSVSMDGMTSSGVMTRTYVVAEPGEDEIGSLFLLFFESRPDNGGQFVDYLEIENPAGINIPHNIDMSDTRLTVTDAYHILAIANIHGDFGRNYLGGMTVPAWMLQWTGKTESDVIAEARARTRSGMTIESGGLLMSGRVEKPANTFEVTLPLVRNQVRFDIINNIKDDYRVVSVEIRNAYPESRVWNDGTGNGVPDFSDDASRIPNYYRMVNADNGSDIMGGLYVFENQVTMPVRNDRFTTNLIIELEELSSAYRSFYRVNIAPEASPQILKRNNAYRVTISDVGGEGDTTAENAYNNPDDNELDYTINAWNLNDTSVMVHDGSSLLSIPYKTVTLPCAEIATGGGAVSGTSASFRIFTFTNNRNVVSPLEIISQTYHSDNGNEEYTGIAASLDGNVMTVTADPIASDRTVKGEIRIGYAGLRATINVVQTDLSTDFLKLHLPDGGIPHFAPFGGIHSGLFRVEASDDAWTARLFMPDGGFTFSEGAGKASLNSILDAGLLIDGNKFRIYTLSANMLETIREAFIVVSLDKDPENFARVIRIAQNVAAGISIVPQHTVTFDGTGNLALISGNTDRQFAVRPSQIGETGTLEPWTAEITGVDADRFVIDDEAHSAAAANPDGNFVRVGAVGKNTSGKNYNATLIVRLVGRPETADSVKLIQKSLSMDFSPGSVPAIPKTGDKSELITIEADPALEWEVLSFNITDGSATKDLVNHRVTLEDQNGGSIAVGDRFDGDGFRVVFPKIYYPNRDIPISATVEIGIVGSSLKKSITVNQVPLTTTPFAVAAPQTGGYGNIHGGSYNQYFRAGIRAMGNVSQAIVAGSNMLYVNYDGLSATYDWNRERNFRGSRDALTMIACDEIVSQYIDALNNSNSPLKHAGFTVERATGRNAVINTAVSGTRIYGLLVSGAAGANAPAVSTSIDFYEDDVATYATAYPSTAVPIVVTSGTGRAYIVIDPNSGLIYLGESQLFDTTAGNPLLDNLLVYIKNATIYGSHFTDLMLDGGEQPAPWDAAWGANAGVSK